MDVTRRGRRPSEPVPSTESQRGASLTLPAPTYPFPERYEDLGLVARGGWGEVRRVRDRAMDRIVVAKVLAQEHVGSESVRSRFMNEARVTASLDHPGVVPVLDGGTFPDGRPWFAMKEVAGKTLLELLDTSDVPEPGVRLRRSVDILLRIAEVVGYAHERRIVHRDLKPGNVMVGRFGEVIVLDWGIARLLGDAAPRTGRRHLPEEGTSVGDILGTMAYMSPEQARGEHHAVGPAADIYALGLILFEVLHGERARSGATIAMWGQASRGELPTITRGPEELQSICRKAVEAEPSDRFPDGMAFASALRAWLEGSARAERASLAVGEAAMLSGTLTELRARRDALRAEATEASSKVRDHDPIDRKRPIWALEDAAEDVERELATYEARRVELLRSALEHDPQHTDAHAALASIYRARLLEAELRGDRAGAAREELLLRQHDRGENAAFLRGVGRVRIASRPRGSRVEAFRWVTRDRRLVAEHVGTLGATPLDVELPVGSYLLELHRDGVVVRYPVVIGRDEVWSPSRDGEGTGDPVYVPSPGEVGDDEAYVPAGPTWVGHDALAAQPVPSRRVWVDGFAIQRTPVTCRSYLEFLDDLAHSGRIDDAWKLAPTLSRAAGTPGSPAVAHDGERFAMLPDETGQPIDDESPIASIDWHAAMEFAAWMRQRTGKAWRLPNELEWEKAARGVDRRPFPWGHQPEPTWACILGSSSSAPRRERVDGFPIDESPYGVRGLAGNVRDWCINTWRAAGPALVGDVVSVDEASSDDPAPRTIRGGAWTSVIAFARAAGRFAAKPEDRFAVVGLRLVRPIGPESSRTST